MPLPAFSLRKAIGPNDILDPDDVFRTKDALGRLGHYMAPEGGLDPWPDPGLIEALKSFQRKSNLRVDGTMNPGGPTAAALGSALGRLGIAPGEWDWSTDRPKVDTAVFAPQRSRPSRILSAATKSNAPRPTASDRADDAKQGEEPERVASSRGLVTPEFLEANARREQNKPTGELSYNPPPDPNAKSRSSELGKYQINRISFQDIGWKDERGNWTDEAKRRGVTSDADFLNNGAAQEAAIQEFFDRKDRNVAQTDIPKYIGQTIHGIKETFPITEAGVMSAVHRQGEGVVQEYMKHQKRNGWKSNFDDISDLIAKKLHSYNPYMEPKDQLLSVETWLRKHHHLPYRR